MTKLREEVESLAPGILNLGSGQPHDPFASPPGKKLPVRLEQEVRAGRSEKKSPTPSGNRTTVLWWHSPLPCHYGTYFSYKRCLSQILTTNLEERRRVWKRRHPICTVVSLLALLDG